MILYKDYFRWFLLHLFISFSYILGDACNKTTLHVTRICNPDQYSGNFIFLDMYDATSYSLQSCHCTLYIQLHGTLILRPTNSPKPNCGSEIHVFNQMKKVNSSLTCSGETQMQVSPSDEIVISIHNHGNKAQYFTDYCFAVSLLASGTSAFTINCPYTEKITTTSTSTSTSTTMSTTSTQSTTTSSDLTSNTMTSTANATDKSIATTASKIQSPDMVDSQPKLEVIIPVSLSAVLFLFVTGLIATTFIRKQHKIVKEGKDRKIPYIIDEIKIDEGDGLKENISHHSSEDLYKNSQKSSPNIVNVKIANVTCVDTPIVSRVQFTKSASDKNLILLSSIPQVTQQYQPEQTISENGNDDENGIEAQTSRDNVLNWRKSKLDDSYYAELQLAVGAKTIITVENLQRAEENPSKIHYSDIITEL